MKTETERLREAHEARVHEAHRYPVNDPAYANYETLPPQPPIDDYWKWKLPKSVDPRRDGGTGQIKPVRHDQT